MTGRTSHSYRAWRRIPFEIGDEVAIRVIDADFAAAPVEDEEDAAHALAIERWERKRHLALKKKFEPKRGSGTRPHIKARR